MAVTFTLVYVQFALWFASDRFNVPRPQFVPFTTVELAGECPIVSADIDPDVVRFSYFTYDRNGTRSALPTATGTDAQHVPSTVFLLFIVVFCVSALYYGFTQVGAGHLWLFSVT